MLVQKRKNNTEAFDKKNHYNFGYLDWNNKIAEHFFNSNQSGKRVWFSVERDLIEKIAKKNNTTFENFIDTLKKGPDNQEHSKQKVCIKAYHIFDQWKEKRDSDYPPYIAYLALFVLAVNHGDSEDFSANNYYGRLRDLLKEDSTAKGQYPSFDKMLELWDDLEHWSLQDKKCEFGEFHLDIYGQLLFVGIPRYQVVLLQEDKKHLFDIFWKMDWDSHSHPTEEEILQALKKNETNFTSRTAKRIRKGKKDFCSELSNRILEELKQYDEEYINGENNQTHNKRGSIVLCLEIDQMNEEVSTSFRCKREIGLPDINEDSRLKDKHSEWKITSSSFSISNKIEKFNIADWNKDFPAQIEKYKFLYKGRKYKVFTPAADKFGISGWISEQRCIPDQEFYLVIHKSLFDKVKKWGETECDKFEELKFSQIPKHWHLFKIKGVNGDSLIKKDIPSLSTDEKIRINCEAGIRISRGNTYFSFAPPKIFITGMRKETKPPVYSVDSEDNDQFNLIQINNDKSSFFLPKNIPTEKQIKIKIKPEDNEERWLEKKIMLVENQLKKFDEYMDQKKSLDCFGNFKSNEEDDINISLSFQNISEGDLKNTENYLKLPYFSSDRLKKIYLIGNLPGEIITWPLDPLPKSWAPVWAIQFTKWNKAKAFSLDNKQKYISSDDKTHNFSKEKIQEWKKIIWNNRKQIKIKSKLMKKWEQFSEEAKNV